MRTLIILSIIFGCTKSNVAPQSQTNQCSNYHVTTNTLWWNGLYYPWVSESNAPYNAGDNGIFYSTVSETLTSCGGAYYTFLQVGCYVKGSNDLWFNTNGGPYIAYGDTIRIVSVTQNSIKVSIHFTPSDSNLASRIELKYRY